MPFTPTAPGSQYGAVLSSTLRAMTGDGIADNVTNGHILYHWLNAKGHKKTMNGGQSITMPVMLSQNTTAESYEGYDPGDHDPQEGLTLAMYPWKQCRVSVSISGIERFMNGGQWAVSDLLAWKVDQAVISLQELLNNMSWRYGAGKDWLGLAQIVSTAPAANTIGMISTANAAWRNYAKASTVTTAAGSIGLLRQEMRAAWNAVARGRDKPTILLVDQGLYEYYEASLVVQERYQNIDVASGEFEGLLFKGAPMFFDHDKPDLGSIDGTATADKYSGYILNHKHLWLITGEGADFVADDFQKPSDQDAWKTWIYCYGNLVCDLRRSHGVLYDVDTDLVI